jgi:oxygen-independent coproporphyrinogen-3 oxidase
MHSELTRTDRLLQRYNRPAPRYTSYPPAPHWQDAKGEVLVSALKSSTAPISIYVHIPFCERLCLYCGCNVVVRKDHSVSDAYVGALTTEMDILESAHGRTVTQLHWGGGTPTHQPAASSYVPLRRYLTPFNPQRPLQRPIESLNQEEKA